MLLYNACRYRARIGISKQEWGTVTRRKKLQKSHNENILRNPRVDIVHYTRMY